jgi:hypothetical protein
MLADKGDGSLNPVHIKNAHAGSLSAAPGYLFLADDFGTKGRILVADSSSQKICVYSVTGDKIRLETVRDFSRDTDIVDSAPLAGVAKGFEGGNGLNSAEAAQYADLIVKWKKEQDAKDGK